MNHEEFLKQVKDCVERRQRGYIPDRLEVLKLLAIIEKLKEQRDDATGIDWDVSDVVGMLAHYDAEIAKIERGEA